MGIVKMKKGQFDLRRVQNSKYRPQSMILDSYPSSFRSLQIILMFNDISRDHNATGRLEPIAQFQVKPT